jgi:hypothetical protein
MPYSATPRSSRTHNARTTRVPVTTILAPSERSAVDAAGLGLYRTMHRSTLDEVRRDLRDQTACFSHSRVARRATRFAWQPFFESTRESR